jgi:hypothetical protein
MESFPGYDEAKRLGYQPYSNSISIHGSSATYSKGALTLRVDRARATRSYSPSSGL